MHPTALQPPPRPAPRCTELVAAIDEAEAARADEAAAEAARKEDAARSRDLLDSQRAELLRAALAAEQREDSALRQLRQSMEALQAAMRQLEERARRLNGALVAPGQPEEAARELEDLGREASRLATVRDETQQQVRAAERRRDNARLARIVAALGCEAQAAQVVLNVVAARQR